MAKILGQDMGGLAMLFGIVMVGFLAALVAASYLGVLVPSGGGIGGAVTGGGGAVPTINLQQVCGSDGLGNVKFRAKNDLNMTSTEWTGDVLYVYVKNADGSIGQLVGTVTSGGTSAYATLADVGCGVDTKLVGYVLSTDAAGGVQSQIRSVDPADGVKLNDKGGVDISMNVENVYITAHKAQHATLEFRYFDIDNNAFEYANQGGSQNAWATTGATFMSTTGNSTGTTVTGGQTLTGTLSVRAAQVDTQFNSDVGGVLIGVNADIGAWDKVSISNANTKEVTSAALTSQEQKMWSNYEYYFQTSDALTNTYTPYAVSIKAQPNPGTWKCPMISFAARGNYLGTTTGNMILSSAAKDDSSYTAVYAVQSVELKVNTCSSSA